MKPSVYSGKNMHLKILNFFQRNGPAFEIGHTDPDHPKKT